MPYIWGGGKQPVVTAAAAAGHTSKSGMGSPVAKENDVIAKRRERGHE